MRCEFYWVFRITNITNSKFRVGPKKISYPNPQILNQSTFSTWTHLIILSTHLKKLIFIYLIIYFGLEIFNNFFFF